MSETTNYNSFMEALGLCLDMAQDYLRKCLIEGKIEAENIRYFKNLLALCIDEETGKPRILCSNTNPQDSHEATHSYNIRFVEINEEVFNQANEESEDEYMDKIISEKIGKLNECQKKVVYDLLKRLNIK